MSRKTLLVLLAFFSSCTFAFGHGSFCIAHPDIVAKGLKSHGGSMTINYSPDELDHVTQCKNALLKQDSTLKINLNKVSGSGKFSFSK